MYFCTISNAMMGAANNNRRNILHVLSLFLCALISSPALSGIDSLKLVLKNSKSDTLSLRLKFEIGQAEGIYRISYWDSLQNEATQLSKDKSPEKQRLGYKYIAYAHNNKGYIFMNQANIIEAIKHYQQSLAIKEKINDQKGKALVLGNLGVIYMNQADTAMALKYNEESLSIFEKIKDVDGTASALNNIGVIYKKMKQYDEAMRLFQKGLVLYKQVYNKEGIAYTFNNIGNVFGLQNNFDSAFYYCNEGLRIRIEIEDLLGMCHSYYALGDLYFKKGDMPRALTHGLKSLMLSKQLGYPDQIKYAAELLLKIYKRTGNYTGAFEMQDLYYSMRDSLNNENARKQALQQKYEYLYDKKLSTDSIKTAQEKKVMRLEVETEKSKKFYLSVMLGLVLLLLVFIFLRYRVSRKQHKIIEQQKQEVETQRNLANESLNTARQQNAIIEKQKSEVVAQQELLAKQHQDILDGINYAQRIQQALLPSEKTINNLFTDYFILNKPREIVSGDFYWINSENTSDNHTFLLATADCTGHGVPGAFMSLLGINFLNEIVKHVPSPDTAGILNKLREQLINVLNAQGSPFNTFDGIDISLCYINLQTLQMNISAAMNPVYIVRPAGKKGLKINGKQALPFLTNNHAVIYKIKADKFPAGLYINEERSFTSHAVSLESGDCVYTLSDGYTDQFGNAPDTHHKKSSKLGKKKLFSVLMENVHKPMAEQKIILDKYFNSWKATNQQTDDVLIIGFRV